MTRRMEGCLPACFARIERPVGRSAMEPAFFGHDPECPNVGRACPDGGTCHHECLKTGGGACFRIFNAGPLSDVYAGDEWPEEVKRVEMAKVGISAPRPLPLRHGAQLDEAIAAAEGGPPAACERHAVCVTAWDSRVRAHVDAQWAEFESGRAMEDARAALVEQGVQEPDESMVLYVALRTMIGGSFSVGLHAGLELAAIAPVERP